MPRPTCPRKICHQPPCGYYKPAGVPLSALEEVLLAADEMESLRLADAEGLYNQDAAQHMGISRQTFERILKRAREKVASALAHGMAIRLEPPSVEQVDHDATGTIPPTGRCIQQRPAGHGHCNRHHARE